MRTYLGRVVRDIEHKTAGSAEQQEIFASELTMARRLLNLKKTDRNKLYSLHAPELERISKGKTHKR